MRDDEKLTLPSARVRSDPSQRKFREVDVGDPPPVRERLYRSFRHVGCRVSLIGCAVAALANQGIVEASLQGGEPLLALPMPGDTGQLLMLPGPPLIPPEPSLAWSSIATAALGTVSAVGSTAWIAMSSLVRRPYVPF